MMFVAFVLAITGLKSLGAVQNMLQEINYLHDYNQHTSYGHLWELKTDHMLPEAKRDGKPIFAMLQFKLHAECTRIWQKFSKAVIYALFNSVL